MDVSLGLESMMNNKAWQNAQNNEKALSDWDYKSDLSMLLMGKGYPQQKFDLWELYKQWKNQQMDKDLNLWSMQRPMQENNLRLRENRLLDPQGSGQWDFDKNYVGIPGRRM